MSIAFLVIALPVVTQASFTSFVSKFFIEKSQAQIINKPNSQQIDLLSAPISSNLSVGGADLNIVDGNSLASEIGPAGVSGDILKESGQISIYVVRDGDSISEIADLFDVSVNTIRWGNDISNNVITPGQTLVILPVSGVRHKVKSGDTLEKIAKTYKGELNEILSYNNLQADSSLVLGSEIIIPGGLLPQTVVSAKKVGSKGSAQPDYQGYYLRPIVGGVKSQGIHGYNGVDLAAPVGTEILASASGIVTVSRGSGWNGGYGSYIVISHSNGTQTLYAHTSQNVVNVGDYVTQGQLIGFVGSTGRSTGPHVHFEIRGAKNPF